MSGFPDLKGVSRSNSTRKQERKNDAKIKIDVSSAEKLISNLSFAAKELEKAVEKVEKNRDLSKILDELGDLKSGDLKNFNQNLSKNLKKIEKSVLQKMSSYASVFTADDVQKTLDEIERIESFTKKFKFKSIVFSVLISLLVGIGSSWASMYFYFYVKNEKYKKELEHQYGAISIVFKDVDYQIGANKKIWQVMIKDKGVSVFQDGDEKFINIPKK